MAVALILPLLATAVVSLSEEEEADLESDGAQARPFAATEDLTSRAIVSPAKWVEDHTKFTLGGSIDGLFMGAMGGGVETAAGVDLTLTAERPIFGTLLDQHLTLYSRIRYRTAVGDLAPASLGETLGTAWGVVDGFSDAGFEIPDLFLRHVFPDQHLEFRYGQMVIDAQLDGQPVGGAKRAFHNRAFSSNPAAAFPRLGAGATAAWDPEGAWDFVYAISTVQGSENGDQVDFQLGSSDYFQALQFGYRFPGKEPGPRRIQMMLWHSDAAPDSNADPGEGVSVTYSHRFEAPITAGFVRFAYAAGGSTDARLLLVGGLTAKFQDDVKLGLGAGIGRGTRPNDWNALVEGFYRYNFGTYSSAGLNGQIILGEGFRDSGSIRFIAGASVRFSF